MPDQVLTTLQIAPNIEPKSSKEIEDNGRTKRQQADVDEVHPYPAAGQSHLICNVATDPKGRTFHELSKLLHRSTVIEKIRFSIPITKRFGNPNRFCIEYTRLPKYCSTAGRYSPEVGLASPKPLRQRYNSKTAILLNRTVCFWA